MIRVGLLGRGTRKGLRKQRWVASEVSLIVVWVALLPKLVRLRLERVRARREGWGLMKEDGEVERKKKSETRCCDEDAGAPRQRELPVG